MIQIPYPLHKHNITNTSLINPSQSLPRNRTSRLFRALQGSSALFRALQRSSALFSALPCSSTLFCALPRSSVLFRALPHSSALFCTLPRQETFLRNRATPPQGLGSPPIKLPRLRETPYDSPGLPCSMIRIYSRLPRRAGIPNASIHRFDARLDLSDLGNSFPGEGLCGLSDRPVIIQTIH